MDLKYNSVNMDSKKINPKISVLLENLYFSQSRLGYNKIHLEKSLSREIYNTFLYNKITSRQEDNSKHNIFTIIKFLWYLNIHKIHAGKSVRW